MCSLDRLDRLKRVVCKEYSLSDQEYISKSRFREIMNARRMTYFLLRNDFEMTFKSIGRAFGVDHATVMHHAKKQEGFLEYDKNEYIRYIKIRDKVFEQNSFLGLKDDLDILERQEMAIADKIKSVRTELNKIEENGD